MLCIVLHRCSGFLLWYVEALECEAVGFQLYLQYVWWLYVYVADGLFVLVWCGPKILSGGAVLKAYL